MNAKILVSLIIATVLTLFATAQQGTMQWDAGI